MKIHNPECHFLLQNGPQSYSHTHYNYAWFIFNYYIVSIFNILVCIFGILGNGMIIWLLGFHIKKSPFTTYILNLAIADFLLLTVSNMFIKFYLKRDLALTVFLYTCFSFFSTSQGILTVISMDRCISIFFPLWYRCHRPKHLSTVVCALIWVLSFLSPAIVFIIYNSKILIAVDIIAIIFLVIGVLSFLLMTISSLMLFIKVCCKAKQQHKRKILITILIIVFFFLFLCFPVNVITTFSLYCRVLVGGFDLIHYSVLCGCLNSSVNPLVYYLVGRRKKRRSSKSMKAALQELFKEEEI